MIIFLLHSAVIVWIIFVCNNANILFASAAQAYAMELEMNRESDAQHSTAKWTTVVDKLFERLLMASPIHKTDMDCMTLGKPAHSAVSLHSSPSFPISRVPSPCSLRAQPQPVPNMIVNGLSRPTTQKDFEGNAVQRQVKVFNARPSSVQVVAEAEPDLSSAKADAGSTNAGEQLQDLVGVVHSEADMNNYVNQSSGLVVLEVTTRFCMMCRMFERKYNLIAQDYSGRVKCLKVVADEGESTNYLVKQRFNVTSAPYFLIFRNGERVREFRGANDGLLRSTLNMLDANFGAEKYRQVEEVHSEEEFDKCLEQSPGLVVLQISRKIGAPCKAFEPIYENIAAEYAGSPVKFLVLMANENSSTQYLAKDRLKAMVAPYLFFFRKGQVIAEARAIEDKVRSTLNACMLPEEKLKLKL